MRKIFFLCLFCCACGDNNPEEIIIMSVRIVREKYKDEKLSPELKFVNCNNYSYFGFDNDNAILIPVKRKDILTKHQNLIEVKEVNCTTPNYIRKIIVGYSKLDKECLLELGFEVLQNNRFSNTAIIGLQEDQLNIDHIRLLASKTWIIFIDPVFGD